MSVVEEVLYIAKSDDLLDLLTWTGEPDGETVMGVRCGDVFGDGYDWEPVESDRDCAALSVALDECHGNSMLWREDACVLYAARRRGERPSKYAYSESDVINAMLDAVDQ